MKILHIVQSISGGAGIAALNIHNSLKEIGGVDSYMIQKTDPSNDDTHIHTIYESKNIFYRLKRKLGLTHEMRNKKLIPMFPCHNEYEIATFPTSSYRLEDLQIVKDADIIHLHWISNFVNMPTFFPNIDKPIVWTVHDKNPFSGVFHFQIDINNNPKYLTLEKKITKEKRNYIAKHKDTTYVFPSNWLLNQSNENLFELDKTKICIPNMTQIPNFKNFNNIQLDELKKIDKEKKIILFIAHSTEVKRKGFSLLQEAINDIDKSLFNLITIGESSVNYNSNNHVHFNKITDRSTIYYLYSQSDIVIIPSLEDNLPNVMLESFSCGTPIISFANGGMAEHLALGKNGILVNDINSSSLKLAILDFLEGKYTFDREKIRQYAIDNFAPMHIANQYKELYTKILKL